MFVESNRYPYIAAINSVNLPNLCGGALISPKLILTSAVCGIELEKFGGQIKLGCSVLDDLICEVRDVFEIFVHSDFDEERGSIFGRDLALVHLAEASSQTPIQMPEKRIDFNSKDVREFGWNNDYLMEVEVSHMHDLERCGWSPEPIYYSGGHYYPDATDDPETMMCSYKNRYNGFLCDYESPGIPSIIPNGGKDGDLLVGILSFPILCWMGEEHSGAQGMYATVNSDSGYNFIVNEVARSGELLTMCSNLKGNCQKFSDPETAPPTPFPTKALVGSPVSLGSYLYTAALLYYNGEVACGGALIAPSIVLTTARCGITSMSLNWGKVVLGCNVVGDTGCETIDVVKASVYPEYDHYYPEEGIDIAVLHLSQPSQQQVVKLADTSLRSLLDYSNCVNLNWEAGQLTQFDDSSIIDFDTCDYKPAPIWDPYYIYHEGAPWLDERMFCSLEQPFRGFACQCLQGMPSIVGDVLVGIFSFEEYCGFGENDGTAIYTRTSLPVIYDFILKEVADAGESIISCSDFSGSQCIAIPATITSSPTANPTAYPTAYPTSFPTKYPTDYPSIRPTTSPTKSPTLSPSAIPTHLPIDQPVFSPTLSPSSEPTLSPTASPTMFPTVSRFIGNPVLPGMFSYVAAIVDSAENSLCGGVLISSKTVLSTAACGLQVTTKVTKMQAYVKLGCNYLKSELCTVYHVERVSVHPKYNETQGPLGGFDIAVFTLAEVTSTPSLSLLQPNVDILYEKVTELNWELEQLTMVSAAEVDELIVCESSFEPYYDENDETYYPRVPLNADTVICTSMQPYDFVDSACNFQSGAPAVISTNTGDVLVGVFSLSMWCAQGQDGSRAVYTSASLPIMYEFILSQVAETGGSLRICSDLNGNCLTIEMTREPSTSPTVSPTERPSVRPTTAPSKHPTSSPYPNPTLNPTSFPTQDNSTGEVLPSTELSGTSDEVSAGLLLILAAIIPAMLLVALIGRRYELC